MGVIVQHLQVGELLLGSWMCLCGFNIWVEKKLGEKPLLAAGDGESIYLTWRGMREETQWEGNSCLGMCHTLAIKSLKQSIIGILIHHACIHSSIPSVHLFVFLFIPSFSCWQIARSSSAVNPQNELSSEIGLQISGTCFLFILTFRNIYV